MENKNILVTVCGFAAKRWTVPGDPAGWYAEGHRIWDEVREHTPTHTHTHRLPMQKLVLLYR